MFIDLGFFEVGNKKYNTTDSLLDITVILLVYSVSYHTMPYHVFSEGWGIDVGVELARHAPVRQVPDDVHHIPSGLRRRRDVPVRRAPLNNETGRCGGCSKKSKKAYRSQHHEYEIQRYEVIRIYCKKSQENSTRNMTRAVRYT